jgi:hypothetical protein
MSHNVQYVMSARDIDQKLLGTIGEIGARWT